MADPAPVSAGGRVSLRPARTDDEDFLRRVYASTRTDELEVTGWDEATKESFLHQQFRAQHDHYVSNYEDAFYDVILVDGEPAGRLYVAHWPEEIRVMDISLLPAFRGRGIGGHLLTAVLEEASQSQKPVTIHVEHANRARALYDRLGFEEVDAGDVYVKMRWTPEGGTPLE